MHHCVGSIKDALYHFETYLRKHTCSYKGTTKKGYLTFFFFDKLKKSND